MRKIFVNDKCKHYLTICSVFLLFALSASAQEGKIIKKITVSGTTTMTPESVLFYTDLKEGEYYSEARVKQTFKNIWASDAFRNLSVEAEDWEDGVEIIIRVEEKPILRRVNYKGAKKLTETKINDIFKQNGVEFRAGDHLNYANVRKAENILKSLLEYKGYKYAAVKADVEEVAKGEVVLTFNMDEGTRTKIQKIYFEGNEAFSNRRLKKQMKKVKEAGPWSSFIRRNILSETKLYDNLQGVVNFYKDRGYVTMTLDEPKIEMTDRGKPKKIKKRAKVTIFVKEGFRYRVGEVEFKGNELFSTDELQPLIKGKEGAFYNHSAALRGKRAMESKYGEKGYIFAHIGVLTKPDAETKIVKLVVDIQESKPYYLRLLEFSGNAVTHDKVLRREFLIQEGDLFNTRYFERSLRKVGQLEYFRITETPSMTPVGDTDKVDVLVKGTEGNRSFFNFGAGYSGLEGVFVNASYTTKNFLGRGETLEVSASLGGRQDYYSISFVEPWIFNKPYAVGGSIYRLERQYVQFDQYSNGGRVFIGAPITYFSRAMLSYSYEETEYEPRGDYEATTSIFEYAKKTIVQLTPSFQYMSVDSVFRPSKGSYFTVALPVSHWTLGSDVSYYKLRAQYAHFFPTYKKTVFAVNSEFGWVRPFSGHRIPASERFFLGGASSIRGYETRSVGPTIDNFVYGGDTYIKFNAEYIIPAGDMFQFAFFADIGDAFTLQSIKTVYKGDIVTLEKGFDFSMPASVGFEFRFFMPAMIPYPIRLIWSKPLNPEPWQRTRTFEFSIGPVFF